MKLSATEWNEARLAVLEANVERDEARAEVARLTEERDAAKRLRIEYQDIVYAVANIVDRWEPENRPCGSAAVPAAVERILKKMHESLTKAEAWRDLNHAGCVGGSIRIAELEAAIRQQGAKESAEITNESGG